MSIRKSYLLIFVCVMFALDSLVKLSLPGFRIHPAHFFIIVATFFIIITPIGRTQAVDFIKENVVLVFFFSFCLLQIIQAESLRQYLLYNSRSLLSFHYVFTLLICLVLLGGGVQYLLNLVFGYHLALGGIDTAYYLKSSSVDSRMRGFFLEPNWFGLFLTFSFVGYALTIKKVSTNSVFLLFFSVMLCSYLSGNRLSNYFVILTVCIFIFGEKYPKYTFLNVIVFGLLPVIYFLISLNFFNGGDISVDDRSLSARTITASRVIDYVITNSGWFNIIFGHGLSNWSNVALENGLTIRSSSLESGAALRDTSETYVLFIEHGLLGCGLLLLDLVLFVRRAYSRNRVLASYAAITATFLLCSAFYYPIFFFMMYLAPYFLIRIYFVKVESVYK
jgi:hypothetical protein